MAEIGATLREARMHARVDVSEIEARTKIRAKYLRALENEEWGLLPGPTFTRSFLRTYAEALGLDGKALVEDYRLHHERPSEGERFEHAQQPLVQTPARGPARNHSGERPSGRGSRAYVALVGAIVLLIVVLSVALIFGGGSGKPKSSKPPGASKTAGHHHHSATRHHPATHTHPPAHTSDLLTLSLAPTAPVWVCLVGAEGNKVIGGVILQPGETIVHRSKHFEITLGNSELEVTLNGKAIPIAAASEPAGYSITASGLQPITPGPECP